MLSGKKRLGRRGVSPILFEEAFQLILAVAAFLMLFSYVGSQASSTFFEANFFSKDIGLIMSSINAVPQNVDYMYSMVAKKGRLDVEISGNIVEIGLANESAKKSFWHSSNMILSQEPYLEKNKSGLIEFAKQGNKISVANTSFDANVFALSCPPLSTKDDGWKARKFIIDPAHGGTESNDPAKRDPGFVSSADPSFYEETYTFFIANALAAKLNSKVLTRQEKEFMPQSKRLEIVNANNDSKALISIHMAREPSQSSRDPLENYVTVYYNPGSVESQKLGCAIVNSLLSKKEFLINGAAVVPKQDNMLSVMQPSVIVEIGNIEIPKEKNFIVNSAKIADAIYSGLGEYYS